MNYQANNIAAVNRLLQECETHGSLILAVDFDNTLYDYHQVGADYTDTILLVQKAVDMGHKVFIFTANEDHEFVKKFCLELGLGDLPVNENELDSLFNSRKPFYNLLLDDRAGLPSALNTLRQVLTTQLKNGKESK